MQRKPLPKIFGFCNGMSDNLYWGIAISEDGTMLRVVACADIRQVPGELGLDAITTKGHDVYGEYYPDGWSGEFIEQHRIKATGMLVNAIAICESRKAQKKPYRFVSKKKITIHS